MSGFWELSFAFFIGGRLGMFSILQSLLLLESCVLGVAVELMDWMSVVEISA